MGDQDQLRECQEYLGDADDDPLGALAEVAGDGAQDGTDDAGQDSTEDADEDGVAAAEEDMGEEVTTNGIGAEDVLSAGSLLHGGQVGGRVVDAGHCCADTGQGHDQNDHQAEDGQTVAHEFADIFLEQRGGCALVLFLDVQGFIFAHNKLPPSFIHPAGLWDPAVR